MSLGIYQNSGSILSFRIAKEDIAHMVLSKETIVFESQTKK